MNADLLALATLFTKVGLIAVGGVIALVPEIQREVVEVRGWMDAHTFTTLYTLAQAAPGPNLLLVTLIGWYRAGLAGAMVATLALLLPTSMLTYILSGVWQRLRGAAWLEVVQNGMNSVTVGLIAAAGLLLVRSSAVSVVAVLISLATVLALLFSKVHPLWLLAGGAVLGALGLV
jgi:chromate transporter